MMDETTLTCQDERRRQKVRAHPDYNGLDYLEVSADQKTLTVYFLEKAPPITRANVRIEGGRRVRDIRVVDVAVCRQPDQDRDDCLIVEVDQPGDWSTYRLCLVEVDEEGKPTGRPMAGIDPRYACLEFTFKAGCPSDLDCKPGRICPPEERPQPEIDYLAKDYASFRRLILDRMSLLMPGWQETHVPDLAITLAEVLAYAGDHLSYYQDAVATEAYLETARQRISVRRHARLVDYQMHEGANARAWLHVETGVDVALAPGEVYFVTGHNDALPANRRVLKEEDLAEVPASSYEVFEPLVRDRQTPIQLYEAHNCIPFHTWGDAECCLPAGTTRATLLDRWVIVEDPDAAKGGEQQQKPPRREQSAYQDYEQAPPKKPKPTRRERALHLQAGDVLIFEEMMDPKTGQEADANPAHRHAVRLTRVEPGRDPVEGVPVVEIEWAEEDALPFALCLSAVGPAPECELLTEISVARGNIILVDHGRRVAGEDLGCVPLDREEAYCEEEGQPADPLLFPGRYRPRLDFGPLTFSQPLPAKPAPASTMLTQDPRQALPWLRLAGRLDATCRAAEVPPPLPPQPDPEDTPPVGEPPSDKPPEEKPPQGKPPEGGAYGKGERPEQQTGSRQVMASQAGRPAQSVRAPAQSGQVPVQSPPQDQVPREPWWPVRDLLASGPQDRHFVAEVDDEGRARLRFGDGELGQQPAAHTRFRTTYRVGIGPAGNVGAEAISHAVARNGLAGAGLKPRNPLPARGGIRPESIEEVKLFAPHAFRRELQRAITADDYAALVMRDFGEKVQRAAAVLRWMGSWYEVLVAVDPRQAFAGDETLLAEIEARLQRYRRMGHDLAVAPADDVPLDLEIDVCVEAQYLRGHVKAALLDLFSNRLLPDGRRGFFHPDNLTFGQGIYVSELVARAQAVPGVENATVIRLERLFEGANGEVQEGILPLSPLEVARLDNDPSFPENGQLKLTMRGGR